MKTKTRTGSLVLAAVVLATLSACASTPKTNALLEQARTRYDAANANPQIVAAAADELTEARDALAVADRALAERKPPATIEHLAYMTSQHVAIAEATAASRASQAVVASAGAERDKLRLDVRTAEADAAQRRLAASEASSAQSARDLASAQAASAQRVAALEAELAELNAKETERGLVVTLGDVLFSTGKAQLLPGGSRNMQKLAEFFAKNPERTASIEGHTDSVGSSAMNYTLSERRAESVLGALVGLGVPRASLSTRALGEDMPTATNETTTGRQMNRRVEIVISKANTAVAER